MGTLLLVATPDVDQVVRVDRCRHYYQTITRHVAAPHEVFIGEKVKIGAKEDYSIIQNDRFIRCQPPIVNSETTNFFSQFFYTKEIADP